MGTSNVNEVVRRNTDRLPCASHRALAIPAAATPPRWKPPVMPITSNLYSAAQAGEVPDTAIKASLGCGNPTALAELKPGETVLDLGSRAAALMCCFLLAASAQQGKPTVST